MKTSEQRLSDILHDVYAAAMNPSHWDMVLQRIATETEAGKASLHAHRFARQDWEHHTAGSRLHSFGYEAATGLAYARHFAVRDPYIQRIRERRYPALTMGTNEDLITASELRRTEFYSDYGRPNRIFFVNWIVIEQNPRFASGLAVIRPENAKQFNRKHAEFLTLLAPHLEQSFRLARFRERTAENTNALLFSLAQLGYAVIALDDDRRIINYSPPAKAFFDERDGIRVHDNRIEATDADQDMQLQRMIDAASQPWGNPHYAAHTLHLSRSSFARPLHVVVLPFPSQLAPGLLEEDRTQVLVFLADPASRYASRGQVLRRLFGLTPTEARLADVLLQGLDVNETAEKMRITPGTVRYHLKQIFSKTGAPRQSELIRLMVSLPGVSMPSVAHKE